MENHAVLRLLNKPQSDWQKPELEEAFLLLLAEHAKAMDGWNVALEENKKMMNICHSLLDSTAGANAMLDALLSERKHGHRKQPSMAQVKRSRGRPKKHDDLSWVDGWLKESYRKFGQLDDRPLIKAAFMEMYERHGMRKGRVESPDVKAQMETFRKLVCERRYQLRRLSRK